VIHDDQRRVTIPADVALAKAERIRVREQFQTNIKDDFYVAGFERHGDTSDYIFIRGASRVDLAD
jgi:hypothetical protein